jgi:hypothetical protein
MHGILNITFINITKNSGPRTDPVAHRMKLHTVSKVRHGSEHGIICWPANYGNKQNKQELVRHHQVDEEAVHAELDRKRF